MGQDTVEKALELAVELAREAGGLLMQRLGTGVGVELKGEIDPVTELDRQVEALLVSRLTRRFPDHDILAEENTRPAGDSEWLWVIDPLDGTTNYAHGYPCFAVSIALEQRGESRMGVIYQPATDEMFTAVAGGGAFLNGRRLAVSGQTRLDSAFLVTGFPYILRQPGVLERHVERFRAFLGASFAVRRDGSAAYDLACVAAGRYDGYWEEHLKHWDTAAGVLMVREAGGVIGSFDGARFAGGNSASVLTAGTPELFASMLALLDN